MNFYQHKNMINDNVRQTAEIEIDDEKLFSIQMFESAEENTPIKFSSSIQLEDNSSYSVIYPSMNARNIFMPYAATMGSGIPLDQYIELFYNSASGIKFFYQIDTGCLSRDEVSIKSFSVPYQNTNFITNLPKTLVEYELNNSIRYLLWERFALTYKDLPELWAAEDGRAISQGALSQGQAPVLELSMADALTDESGSKYFPIGIRKYDAKFIAAREESIDANTVFIKTTSGVANTDRIALVNGKAEWRLYPMGYLGALKVKYGFKYYNPWCEYNLLIKA